MHACESCHLAINHSCVADILFYFNSTRGMESLNTGTYDMNDKGKGKVLEGEEIPQPDGLSMECDVPILLFTKLLNHRNIDHLEQADSEKICKETHGYVGADLAALCTEAALQCIREKMDVIDLEGDSIDAEILNSMTVSNEHFQTALGASNPSA